MQWRSGDAKWRVASQSLARPIRVRLSPRLRSLSSPLALRLNPSRELGVAAGRPQAVAQALALQRRNAHGGLEKLFRKN